ncbi:MAG: aminotransferase class III-fold pyridoxal phosphate-dependent enzyme, partial [Candidatus Micrarchaeota archaeon]
MDSGLELWKKAKKIIPGGTQLLSKRSEMYLPDHWPSFYSKAKGIDIWDLDGQKYTDMTIMGIGACILGYADDDVDDAVTKAVSNGSMCTLNCPEDVELAEKLIALHPWASQVRYSRTGGEAMAIAVRIARAHTKREKVAFCGYHGWHDWYLAANLADEANLDGHLLPGLDPAGVPRGLSGTAIPFAFNKIDELEAIVAKDKNLAAIIIEPMRHDTPAEGFLKRAREIADEIGAVLIYDEVTAAWRKNVGGVHKLFGVNPDIAVLGKAMSNGFPMAAIIGTNKVMDAVQTSFISSTYWTDRIGPTAALATIKKMEDQNVPGHLVSIGKYIGQGWKKTAQETGIKLNVMFDMEPLIAFSLDYGEKSQAMRTLFTQEMLKRGYLASNSVYVSFAHQKADVDWYMEQVTEVFKMMKKA